MFLQFGKTLTRLSSGSFGVKQYLHVSAACNKKSKQICNPDCGPKKCSPAGEEVEIMSPACKVAIITGGSTGIGLSIAQQLLCGGLAKAIIADTNACEGIKAVKTLNSEFGKGKAVYYEVDVNCHKQFEGLMKEIIARFQRVDILVNNAGMLNDRCWETECDLNLKSVVRGNILALQYMAKNGKCSRGCGGLIINVASILGLDFCPPIPVYTATKHGVIGLTKCMGHKYHELDTQLRVIAICPGVTKTAHVEEAASKQLTEQMGKDAVKALRELKNQTTKEVALAAIHGLKYAPTGSIYLIEDGRLYLYEVPPRDKLAKLIKSIR